jgi:hypothetical protein
MRTALAKRLAALETHWPDDEMDPELAEEIERLEGSLIDFVEAAWPSIDSSEFLSSWAIEGLCEHLEAVTEGQIDRLLVNFPPRSSKTLIASVCWPAWVWARSQRTYRSGPNVKFLCGSYGHTLSILNSTLSRRLILSPWYQERWGKRFHLRIDQNTKSQFDNSAGGSRLATSVGGSLLGLGGDIIVCDDPHNTESVESEAERQSVLGWWKELSTTRLNDPRQAAIVVIMQRLHEEDVSGTILASDEVWTHYCVPMKYDPARHCSTMLGWNDPRGVDDYGEPLVNLTSHLPRDQTAARILMQERAGALMWPERFGAEEVAKIERGLGPYMASGRLQQMPVPEKGGIFQLDWWQIWDHPKGKFPRCEYVVASVDGAFTEKEENDPSAMTVWGKFRFCKTCQRAIDDFDEHGCQCGPQRVQVGRIILLDAWRQYLPFSGMPVQRRPKRRTRCTSGVRNRIGDWLNGLRTPPIVRKPIWC